VHYTRFPCIAVNEGKQEGNQEMSMCGRESKPSNRLENGWPSTLTAGENPKQCQNKTGIKK